MQNKKIELLKIMYQTLKRGKLTEKTSSLIRYMHRYPESPMPHTFLGDAYRARKEYQKAFEHYKNAERLIAVFGKEQNIQYSLIILRQCLVSTAMQYYQDTNDSGLLEKIHKILPD